VTEAVGPAARFGRGASHATNGPAGRVGSGDDRAAGAAAGGAPRAELRVWDDDACRTSSSTGPWPPHRAPSC
jgi:hypothetical protein